MTSAVESFEPAGPLFEDRVFDGFFVLVAVLMIAMSGVFLWLLVRNVRALRRVDPALGQRSGAALAQRLQELDDLHRRGVISDSEHSMARQRVLTSP